MRSLWHKLAFSRNRMLAYPPASKAARAIFSDLRGAVGFRPTHSCTVHPESSPVQVPQASTPTAPPSFGIFGSLLSVTPLLRSPIFVPTRYFIAPGGYLMYGTKDVPYECVRNQPPAANELVQRSPTDQQH